MVAIIFWAMPFIDEKKMQSEREATIYSFEIIESSIISMLTEGYGAKRTVGLICPNDQGLLTIDPFTDKLIVLYSYDDDYDFYVTGLNDEDTQFDIHLAPGFRFENAIIYFLKPDGNYPPPDLSEDFITPSDFDITVTPVFGTYSAENTVTVTSSSDLKGNLLIDLYANFVDTVPTGRIWVFDLGSITYNAYYSPGTQKTVYQNSAILSTGFNDKGIINPPSFITTVNSTGTPVVALRVIQINGSSSVGGRSTPRLGLDLKNNIKREEPLSDTGQYCKVNNLKFQFYGENKQTWIDYFTQIDSFTIYGTDPNTINYINYDSHDNMVFILDCSFIQINIG